MRRRSSASFATPAYVARDTVSISWGYFVITAICACVLAAGFFLAAKQHFNTMDFGMKNSKLRKQVEDLQTEKRRLLLAREVSLSPAEIKRAARTLGFRERGEIGVTLAASTQRVDAKKADRAATVSHDREAPRPVKASYAEATFKSSGSDTGIRKTVLQSAKKDGSDMRTIAQVR